MSLVLPIKRLDSELPMPAYAYPGDAAFDLYAREEVTLAPGERYGVPSGLQMEIPEGYVGLIWDKSGLSIRSGIKTLGGVVDSGFRGEILIGVINLGNEPYTFQKYDKVAQMIIQKKESVLIVEEQNVVLSASDRGEKGFGSSGK